MTDNKTPGAERTGMIPVTCPRKGKTVNVRMPVSAMGTYISDIEARERNAVSLLETLGQLPAAQVPDLIVVFRGQPFALPTIPVDEKQDIAIRRALNTALGGDVTVNAGKYYDVPPATSRADAKAETESKPEPEPEQAPKAEKPSKRGGGAA